MGTDKPYLASECLPERSCSHGSTVHGGTAAELASDVLPGVGPHLAIQQVKVPLLLLLLLLLQLVLLVLLVWFPGLSRAVRCCCTCCCCLGWCRCAVSILQGLAYML